jgi:hypothetical protein
MILRCHKVLIKRCVVTNVVPILVIMLKLSLILMMCNLCVRMKVAESRLKILVTNVVLHYLVPRSSVM